MNDFCVTITSQYNDVFLGYATTFKPLKIADIHKYISQIFNSMANFNLVTKPNEALICVIINAQRGSAQIVVIGQANSNFIGKENVKDIIKTTINHPIAGETVPVFDIEYNTLNQVIYHQIPKRDLDSADLYKQIYTMITSDLLDIPISFVALKN